MFKNGGDIFAIIVVEEVYFIVLLLRQVNLATRQVLAQFRAGAEE